MQYCQKEERRGGEGWGEKVLSRRLRGDLNAGVGYEVAKEWHLGDEFGAHEDDTDYTLHCAIEGSKK